MVNGKTFENRPIKELIAIVKQDFRKIDEEGLIDEGTLIKTVMYCNDRLGINIREVKQCVIPVEDFKAKLPDNFEKLHFVAAIKHTNSSVVSWKNPFDNSFDRDIIYEARVDRGNFGYNTNYNVTINKITDVKVESYSSWAEIEIAPSSFQYCNTGCPNIHKPGKYQVVINDDYTISTPFKTGELYIMYLATMQNEEGDLLYPFHPIITPYYEWMLKEKILMDAVFNSDGDYANKLKLAQQERAKAWLDAYNFTMDKSYNEQIQLQKKKEQQFYNQWFSMFK